jgi:hypothetical protein
VILESSDLYQCVVGGETSSHFKGTYSEKKTPRETPLCYVKAVACSMWMSHIPLLFEACFLFQISLRYINMGWTHPAWNILDKHNVLKSAYSWYLRACVEMQAHLPNRNNAGNCKPGLCTEKSWKIMNMGDAVLFRWIGPWRPAVIFKASPPPQMLNTGLNHTFLLKLLLAKLRRRMWDRRLLNKLGVKKGKFVPVLN